MVLTNSGYWSGQLHSCNIYQALLRDGMVHHATSCEIGTTFLLLVPLSGVQHFLRLMLQKS